MPITIDDLRRFAVARNFPKPVTLKQLFTRIGFVQADPIRSPARAQDLVLRQRVKNYHAGDLEKLYSTLDIEEDFFVNYGYVTRQLQTLMHPRSNSRARADDIGPSWPMKQRKQARLLLEFVRQREWVHPRTVDDYFAHGRVTNYWGGSSNATTHLLDALHYQGLLKIVRREKGIRIYAAQQHASGPDTLGERRTRIDALVDVVVRIYGPLPGKGLGDYVRRLRYATPQWTKELSDALQRAKKRLPQTKTEGVDWYWSADESPTVHGESDTVRLLAPFDPLVHDRYRFELFWNWTYRFEAYTPAAKRKLGYYAMPMLWRDEVIGWANLSVKNNQLTGEFGYVKSEPKERAFKVELAAEVERIRNFL